MRASGAVLLIAGLAACSPSRPPATTASGLPEGAQILGADSIPEMLRQCSRDTPEPGEGNWTPDARSITAMERLLPVMLKTQRGDRDWSGFPTQWVRQYVGIVRDGRRYIYGNYARNFSGSGESPARVVMVCDGGASFFGAEYDVEAGSISHLAFNGVT